MDDAADCMGESITARRDTSRSTRASRKRTTATCRCVWDAGDYADDARRTAFFADAARVRRLQRRRRSRSAIPTTAACSAHSTPASRPSAPSVARSSRRQLGELCCSRFRSMTSSWRISSTTSKSLMSRVAPLSKREQQCLQLAAQRNDQQRYRVKLGITERTANFHFSNMIQQARRAEPQGSDRRGHCARLGTGPITPSLSSGNRPMRAKALRR